MHDGSEHLELRTEAGGLRYYLAGIGIHSGELLEIQLDDGAWCLGRYEWMYRRDEPPALYLESDGPLLDITSRHRLRWPKRS